MEKGGETLILHARHRKLPIPPSTTGKYMLTTTTDAEAATTTATATTTTTTCESTN